jgi:hypothetical protein
MIKLIKKYPIRSILTIYVLLIILFTVGIIVVNNVREDELLNDIKYNTKHLFLALCAIIKVKKTIKQ